MSTSASSTNSTSTLAPSGMSSIGTPRILPRPRTFFGGLSLLNLAHLALLKGLICEAREDGPDVDALRTNSAS